MIPLATASITKSISIWRSRRRCALPCGGKKRARRTLAFRPREVPPPALHARCANSTCGQTLEHSSVPFDSPPSAGAAPASVTTVQGLSWINFQRATQTNHVTETCCDAWRQQDEPRRWRSRHQPAATGRRREIQCTEVAAAVPQRSGGAHESLCRWQGVGSDAFSLRRRRRRKKTRARRVRPAQRSYHCLYQRTVVCC